MHRTVPNEISCVGVHITNTHVINKNEQIVYPFKKNFWNIIVELLSEPLCLSNYYLEVVGVKAQWFTKQLNNYCGELVVFRRDKWFGYASSIAIHSYITIVQCQQKCYLELLYNNYVL